MSGAVDPLVYLRFRTAVIVAQICRRLFGGYPAPRMKRRYFGTKNALVYMRITSGFLALFITRTYYGGSGAYTALVYLRNPGVENGH